jgi:hypothetical protein
MNFRSKLLMVVIAFCTLSFISGVFIEKSFGSELSLPVLTGEKTDVVVELD